MTIRTLALAAALTAIALLLGSCCCCRGNSRFSLPFGPQTTTTASTGTPSPPAQPQASKPQPDDASDEPVLDGTLLYTSAGNLYQLNLADGDEMQVTSEGVADGDPGPAFGCPVFIDNTSLAFLRWVMNSSGAISERSIVVGQFQSEADPLTEAEKPTGLGYSAADECLYYLDQEGPSQGGDDFGEELTVFRLPKGGTPEPTRLGSWFGDASPDHARLRVSPDGQFTSVPRFPTDVSDIYGIYRTASGRPVDVLPESALGRACVTGVDFTNDGAWATIMRFDPACDFEPGLYRLDLSGGEHELILGQDYLFGLAVSDTLGIAVVADEDDELTLVDLASGETTLIGLGKDPDIWPK